MQKIKLALKVFNSKSHAEKILLRLENQSIHDVSEEKQLNPLINCFKDAELTEDGGATMSHLFNSYLRNCKTWQSAFKFLYVSHALMNAVGNRFCHSFLTEHFENILDLMKSKNVEDYVHAVLAANYYNFLILYAKYLPDIRKHEMKGPERFLKSLQEGDYTELVQIVTFKNVIKYFTKVEECIEGSANMLPENKLINKISVLLFKDVVVIYNLIRRNLQFSMNKIFEIDAGLALLLDQLYSDTIQITNKLQSLVNKLSWDKANQIPKIHYFAINLDFNKHEELFILELKKRRAQQGIEEKNESYYGYMQQYQTLNPGRKLYKLNTKVSQLTKISESEGPRTNKNYFNLGSPEQSQFEEAEAEDDSYSPMKLNEIMNGGGDDDDDDDNKNNILGMVDNEVAGRDVTRTLQMELVSPKSKLFPVEDQGTGNQKNGFRIRLDQQEYQPRVGAESVIFTPTAVHHYPSQNGEHYLADSPNLYANKKQSSHNLFGDDYDFAQMGNKKRFNLNPNNF